MDDTDVDEDKCFLLSLLPSFRQFNDEQNFLAPMEILKIMRHVKLQQNLDRYSSYSLPSFSNINSFLPNSSHFATNPQNPQPVTSMQNSEILSQYLSNYSVQPQRPLASTSALPQYHVGNSPSTAMHLSCPMKTAVVTYLLSYLLVQQQICKRNLFFYLLQFLSWLRWLAANLSPRRPRFNPEMAETDISLPPGPSAKDSRSTMQDTISSEVVCLLASTESAS